MRMTQHAARGSLPRAGRVRREMRGKGVLAATRQIVRTLRSARICKHLFAAVLLLGAVSPAWAQMNMLVVMTDDQRFDSLDKMPNVADIASQGVTFTNAYVPTPLCAPSRASIYSGGFLSQNTGVLDNQLPNGGARVFNDKVNLGTVLQ
ncbi:MAG TPA: sulfatase-like hydrolase/transferase, partial [Steroidobacteraceae bacterium]